MTDHEEFNGPAGHARVLFLIRVPQERTEEFLQAYASIRNQVAEEADGHLVDQVCRSTTDPEQWLITTEWQSVRHFRAWERSAGHRALVRPLRVCATEAQSMCFTVEAQTVSARAHTG